MAFTLRRPPKMKSKHKSYLYQLDAFNAIKNLPYASIFHEQGLGKTKIATDLMLFWLAKDIVDTVFVVTKKMLVKNWCEELENHSYLTPRVLSDNRGSNNMALNSPVLVYVMNYEFILSQQEVIEDFLATCNVGIILDECQKIKNPESKLSKCFHEISQKFIRKIIMSGTPVANRPYDIWSQIKFLDGGKSLGNSFAQFKKETDLPTKNKNTSSYHLKLVDISKKIRPFSVRETKESAGIELPNKEIVSHFIDIATEQKKIYSSYKDRLYYELKEKSIDDAEEILKLLLRLVQCASNPFLVEKQYEEKPAKYNFLINLLEEINTSINKAIIWTGFVDNIEWLYKNLSKYNPKKVHGRMPILDRNESIRLFKEQEKCRILLATPGAAKEGLTLTVANHAIFYDRSFSLDDYLQAQDRIHRISQNKDCFIHKFIAKDTIDEYVDELLEIKHRAAKFSQGDTVLESSNKFDIDLSELLSKVLGRNL